MKEVFLIIFCIFNFALLNEIEDDILEIPLKSIRVKDIPKHSDNDFEKLEIDDNHDEDIVLKANEGQAFCNANLLYLATISLGSNHQTFNLLLDTGSYFTWVALKGSFDAYTITHHYDPSISTSSKDTGDVFSFEEKSRTCSGHIYTDKFTYLDSKEFSFRFGGSEKTSFNINKGD